MLMMLVAACGPNEAARGAERSPLDAKVIVDVGGFFMSTETRVRVDGDMTNARGTDLEFDATFGLGDFTRFRAEALWRIGERHTIRGMYFENNRSSTASASQDIHFGDDTFPLGASVTARSKLTVVQLVYDYAFIRRDRYELAAGIGLHLQDLGLSLSATLTDEDDSVTDSIEENAATTAPLPVVSLRGVWSLPHNFYLTGQVQYSYIHFDPYKGGLSDLKAALVWQATDHFGIGVGYNDFHFRFDLDDERDFEGRLRWNYGGAVAFASFMF